MTRDWGKKKRDWPRNSPLVKILQFYFNSAHILTISPTHEVTLLTKFHNDCAKIVEFLLVASFGLSLVFFAPVSKKTMFNRNICLSLPLGGLPNGRQMGRHWLGESVRLIDEYVYVL